MCPPPVITKISYHQVISYHQIHIRIFPPIPTSKTSISGIPAIVNIGK